MHQQRVCTTGVSFPSKSGQEAKLAVGYKFQTKNIASAKQQNEIQLTFQPLEKLAKNLFYRYPLGFIFFFYYLVKIVHNNMAVVAY